MTRSIERITKEGRVNFAIKHRKSQNFQILFHSLWDEVSKDVMDVAREWEKGDGNEILLTVNSWDLPHAFMAFKVTKAPCLVTCRRGRITKQDYVPLIYKHFETRTSNGAG